MADQKSPNKETKSATDKVTPIEKASEKVEAKVEEKVQEVEKAPEGEVTEITSMPGLTPSGKIRVANITDCNIHVTGGKIFKKSEGFVTQEDLDAENEKDPRDRRFIEV